MSTNKMTDQTVAQYTTLHCNRCDEGFVAQSTLTREPFCGQQAARVQDFVTCPHCQQTDGHWVYAKDVLPTFEGNFEQRRRAMRQWLGEN